MERDFVSVIENQKRRKESENGYQGFSLSAGGGGGTQDRRDLVVINRTTWQHVATSRSATRVIAHSCYKRDDSVMQSFDTHSYTMELLYNCYTRPLVFSDIGFQKSKSTFCPTFPREP